MAFCIFCGAQVPDDSKFCPTCGTSMGPKVTEPATPAAPPVQPVQQPVPPPVQQPVQPMQQPAYSQQPPPAYGAAQGQPYAAPLYMAAADPNAPLPPGSKYEPVTTGGFIGIMLLMLVPIVNLILLLIWACGGCRKVNQTNFARAMLLMMLVGLLLSVLISFLFKSVMGDVFGNFMQEINELKQIIPTEGIE